MNFSLNFRTKILRSPFISSASFYMNLATRIVSCSKKYILLPKFEAATNNENFKMIILDSFLLIIGKKLD
jgi:hypothetical protein